MNTMRGGVLRDVYALIYQLEHDTRSNGTVKISIAYISERLGYSNQRNVQRAIAELKEMGLLEVEYGNGKRSIFKTQTPAKIAPPTPYIFKDNRIDNSSSSPACARERLQKWFEESSIKEWANMLLQRNHFDKDTTSLLDDFFDNDFEVREDCEQSRRMEVLKHFQNWLPKYINKLKNEQNNGNNHTSTSTKARNSGIISPEDFARSFGLGWNIGKREQ